MKLPSPRTDGPVSLERTIHQRRTVRAYSSEPLSLERISQLMWAANGVTQSGGFKRAAPSAGALYPMDVYLVTGGEGVEQLEPGVYHYEIEPHALSPVTKGEVLPALARASLYQTWMAGAPVNVVITAEYSRITGKYKERGIRYAMMEAGHIGQNLFLQAGALGLVAGIVGAFDDKKVIDLMKIPPSHEPMLAMPVGYPA